ncbi:pyrroline-5-carboxylate reductase family protein [Pseudochelatococcus sp. B33]
MIIDVRIGIVGGNGWLGNAIASAAVASGTIDGGKIIVSGRSTRPGLLKVPGAEFTHDNSELVARSDAIVLSVRPDQFGAVEVDAKGKLVISVMAGVTADHVMARTGATSVVRAIPNAAAAIGRSFTPWFATPEVTQADKAIVQALFSSCGDAAEVPLESHIDYCVGMTGSGAAFPALLAEALVAHAKSRGLPENFARRAAKGIVAGASQLVADETADTAAIVKEMIDYGGTTAAALRTMLDMDFNGIVGAGLTAATRKAEAMMKGSA